MRFEWEIEAINLLSDAVLSHVSTHEAFCSRRGIKVFYNVEAAFMNILENRGPLFIKNKQF